MQENQGKSLYFGLRISNFAARNPLLLCFITCISIVS